MIRQIVKDVFFLSQKSEPATKQDLSVGQDLMDTLRDKCMMMNSRNVFGQEISACLKKK